MNALAILSRAARRLHRTPLFTATVVLLLGIALAALLTLGSAAWALLWRPLPYAQGERLAVVQGFAAQMQASIGFAPGLLDDLAGLPGVEGVGAFDYAPELFDEQGGRFRNVHIERRLLDLLGATPQLGRVLRDDDAPDAAVLSDAVWRGRFGADPGIVGRSIDFDGTRLRIVGVMAPGFRFPARETALWRPLALTPAQRDGTEAFNFGTVQALARLAPGASLEAFRDAVATRLGGRPELAPMRKHLGLELYATSLRAWWDGGRSSMLALLAAAGAALLALLLANVGSLWLARCLERARELAVSSALGATSRRLAVEMVCEVAIVSGTAVGLALLAVAPGLRVLEAAGVLDASLPQAPAFDAGTLALAALAFVALATVLSFAPILIARHPQALVLLGQGSRAAGGGRAAQRARRALVALQVGLAVTLLCGAGLLTRSLWNLLAQDVGFQPQGVSLLLVESRRHDAGDTTAAAGSAALETLRARLAAAPGVQQVAVADVPPFSFSEAVGNIKLDDAAQSDVQVNNREVGAGYFAALGLRVLRGRDFAAGDESPEGGGVVVDQHFVDVHLAGQDPLRARVAVPDGQAMHWRHVVGVVPTVRHNSLAEPDDKGTLYRFDARPALSQGRAFLVLRGEVPQQALATLARDAAAAQGLRVTEVAALPARMRETLSERLPLMTLTIAFAALGTLLAAVGLFALVSFAVQRRLPEFGIRLALGAAPRRLQGLALREGLRAAVPGLVLGVFGAFAAGRLLAARLFEVSSADPLTLAAVLAGALALVLSACALPARRAARLDPASTLRHY
jgi:putative ABC transport system permease protein